jgi:hypothetical protein
MPILLWVVYPIVLWSACAGIIAPLGEAAHKDEPPNH